MQTGKILDPEQREKYDFTRTILTVLLRTVTGNSLLQITKDVLKTF